MSQLKVLVISPTYNEIDSIDNLISRLRIVREKILDRFEIHLLVVDDGSPDGTSQRVKSISGSESAPWIHIIDRTHKSGLGPAYIAGFTWGLARPYDVLCEIDADLSHQPEELINLLDALDGHDLAIGTRWISGGSVINWPLSRQLISRIGTWYARAALKMELRDITSGYRAFHREVIESIDVSSIHSQGYCFQIEVALRSQRAGFSIAQVPITFVERVGGVSKMSKKIVAEALWNVTKWGFGRYRFRR